MTMSEGLQNLKKGRPGILDVARKAGVSPATVSRVINGTANVTAETREIVQKTIDELNYSPNKFARSLVTNHSGIIGVLVDRSIRYATANVLVQLEEYASMLGYMSVVLTVDKPFHSQFQQAMTKLRSMSVEGIIVIAPRIGLSQTIVDCQIPEPVIIVSSELKDIGIPMVGEDQYEGASRAVRHLIRLGHRNIWHLAGSMDWFDEQQRLNGWKDTLASNHVHGRHSRFERSETQCSEGHIHRQLRRCRSRRIRVTSLDNGETESSRSRTPRRIPPGPGDERSANRHGDRNATTIHRPRFSTQPHPSKPE